MDPYEQLQIVFNGSLPRFFHDSHTPSSSNTTLATSVLVHTTSVATKDVTINQTKNTWVRLFLPTKAISNKHKLPLIVFFHGGGFIMQSASSTMYHDFCEEMADTIEAVVASVDYRRAPNTRLPGAYDDAVEALHWIKSNKDKWLTQYVDYSSCYLMGNSAGATIAYHAGLRAVEEIDLETLKIQGMILRQPFFGGTQRTDSERRLENNPVLPLVVNDFMWESALPIGVNRDHEFCNLRVLDGLDKKIDKIRELGWRVLVSGNGEDPLVDRDNELAELMEDKGVKVVKDFEEEGCHGVEYYNPSNAKQLIALVKGFICV